MSANAELFRDEVLRDTLAELSNLRQKAEALPDQAEIECVIEAVEYYTAQLPLFTNFSQAVEFCGRAIADVTHEIAGAEYGWDSDEADAVFDEQEKRLNVLLSTLRQVNEAA